LKDRPAVWQSALGVGVSKAQPGFDALPDVAEELHGIIRDGAAEENGSRPLRGRVLLDEAFTEPALRTELRLRPPVVHVASHFQFRPGNESDSFLLLGDGRRLSVADLKSDFNLFEGVDLLTLSACDTATGGAGATGKEVESFGALAQRNGAKAVIATLWPVADASTRVLMQRFYRARTGAKGLSKAEALQGAQLALLRGDRAPSPRAGSRARTAQSPGDQAAGEASHAAPYAHPFYWAPFLLIGNWR
jgi:CHAT domain-containing protein